MHRKRFSWWTLAAIGIASVVAVSARAALTDRSASPFELVAVDRYEAECPDCFPSGGHVGTFTSAAPFCASGTVADIAWGRRNESARHYTCSDGSGTLTLLERNFGSGNTATLDWRIVEGSGAYANLRGKGSYSYEVLSEYPPAIVYRTSVQGSVVTADTVAPSAAFAFATAVKLRRPAGSYSVYVDLSLRDDLADTVKYTLWVKEGPEHPADRRRPLLSQREGSTASGWATTNFRIRPSSKRVRSVELLLTASDPDGNEVSIARSLTLPR